MSEPDVSIPPEYAELVSRQAARWNDPRTQQDAQARVAQVNVQAQRNEPRLRTQLKQLEKAPAIKHKIFWLRQMAETFAEAVAPHAACKDSCSGCCHQPVSLTLQEAEVIARETGIAMRMPASWSTGPVMRYAGQACPFLKDARCTIYRHRPLVCRLIFSMDADALLCQMVPGARSQAPYADHGIYKELYIRSHLGRVKSEEEMQVALKSLRMADLREFFPQGPQTTAADAAGDGQAATGADASTSTGRTT
jgi:Fe-S-cluster containining protein